MKRHRRLSKSDMVGFIVLMTLILAIVLAYNYRDFIFAPSTNSHRLSEAETEELERFSKQIQEESMRQEKEETRKTVSKKRLTPFPFDPNTADSATLSRLGLQQWQISNLLKYRSKGGKWRRPEDFAHLYGLSAEDYKILQPFIRIRHTATDSIRLKKQSKRDSLHKSYPKKFEEGTVIALNEADTTKLKGIPGIGSYYAAKICRYRDRLGGFVSTEQLKEIEGLPEGIEKWFTLPPNPEIRKTQINRSSFKDLIRHPYLNYEQVKVICNYIRKYGKIRHWEELSNSEHFTPEDFERLAPYSSFE